MRRGVKKTSIVGHNGFLKSVVYESWLNQKTPLSLLRGARLGNAFCSLKLISYLSQGGSKMRHYLKNISIKCLL